MACLNRRRRVEIERARVRAFCQQKSALMNKLSNKAVERKTLSSPLLMAARHPHFAEKRRGRKGPALDDAV
jgi:hypothetical protein